MRNNGGGNTNIGTEILKYITNDTLLYEAKQKKTLNIPSFKAWWKSIQKGDTINNEWKKKAYLISLLSDKKLLKVDYPLYLKG